ncbi:hypothetical protein HZS_1432 [Henneguya salminicola]|nr:hypothetical protein HZS_1432 [Henneguya salminicola]
MQEKSPIICDIRSNIKKRTTTCWQRTLISTDNGKARKIGITNYILQTADPRWRIFFSLISAIFC